MRHRVMHPGTWVSAWSTSIICALVLLSSRSITYADGHHTHEGLAGLTCAWVDAEGSEGIDTAAPLFRELVRSNLPRLKIDPNCPDVVKLVMRTLNTPSGSARASTIGLEVDRDVLIPVQPHPIAFGAVVWRTDYLYVTSGPSNANSTQSAMKEILSTLMAKLRDDYALAGN